MKGKKITDATEKEKSDASGWYYNKSGPDAERDPKLEKARE